MQRPLGQQLGTPALGCSPASAKGTVVRRNKPKRTGLWDGAGTQLSREMVSKTKR